MIEKLLSKGWVLITMVLLLLVFLRQERLILNFPIILSILLYVIPFIFLGFFYWYKFRKRKSNNFLIVELLGIFLISFFLYIVLKTCVNFWIKESAESKQITKVLLIDNFISGRSGMIYFYFKNQRYSLRYDNENHLSREELINNYSLSIDYSNSIFDTYVINKYYIVIK